MPADPLAPAIPRLAEPVSSLRLRARGRSEQNGGEPRSTYSERAVEALSAGRAEPRRRPSKRHRRAGAARRRRPRLLLRPRLAGLRRVHLPPPPFPRYPPRRGAKKLLRRGDQDGSTVVAGLQGAMRRSLCWRGNGHAQTSAKRAAGDKRAGARRQGGQAVA